MGSEPTRYDVPALLEWSRAQAYTPDGSRLVQTHTGAIDALAAMLQKVRDLIGEQPCRCEVTGQGLQMCRRCLLLKR